MDVSDVQKHFRGMLLSSVTEIGEVIPVYTSSNKYLARPVMKKNFLLFVLNFVFLFSIF